MTADSPAAADDIAQHTEHPAHEHHDHGADDQDRMVLTTVGIDIGSSTSHLLLSRVTLERPGGRVSARFRVVRRAALWRSPIMLTPYRSDNRIDVDALWQFIDESYADAGFDRDQIDSGAIILTGQALKRRNARAIAELFAEHAGHFVCASAGHNLEARLAAHGSGAVALSRARGQVLLHLDIGGGTTKLALIDRGLVLSTAAISIGGRLVATDAAQRLLRVEPEAQRVAAEIGISLIVGEVLSQDARQALVGRMVEEVIALLQRRAPSALASDLMLTPGLEHTRAVDFITFSGGVAEYIYAEGGLEDFSDLGPDLGAGLRGAIRARQLPAPLLTVPERIRATAIGASQFSVQVSGSTIFVSDPRLLPLRNVPVVAPALGANTDIGEEIARAYRRLDLVEGKGVAALAFRWTGPPSYRPLRALAEGIWRALRRTMAQGAPMVLVFDQDVGRLIGEILRRDLGVTNDLVVIDNIELGELDYIDVGQPLSPSGVLPVVVKTLILPEASP